MHVKEDECSTTPPLEYGTQKAYDQIGIIGSRFLALAQQGNFGTDEVEQMGDIAAGRLPGRRGEDEVIVYSVGGMPVEDVAWAYEIYQRAQERDLGTVLNLWDVPAAS